MVKLQEGLLTVRSPTRVRYADPVAGMMARIPLEEFHAVGGVPSRGELRNDQLFVGVDGGDAGRVVTSIPQDRKSLRCTRRFETQAR